MKQEKTSYITIVAIVTTITIVVWIAFSALQRLKKVEYLTIPPKVLAPLNPNLDKAALEALEKKRVMTEEEISLFSQKPRPGKAAEATTSAEASLSAQKKTQ